MMSDSADANCAEAEPLKGQQEEEETDRSSGCGCAGKTGVAKLSGWRTATLLLSLFICLSVVFAFSFILPCPVRAQYSATWNLTLHNAVTYKFLAFGDASKDKVQDVFVTYKSSEGHMNTSCIEKGLSSPCLFLLAVDGAVGNPLWETPLTAEFQWAECGVGGVNGEKLCVVAHGDKLTPVNMHTGEFVWNRAPPLVANSHLPVISLPDLNKDKTNDIAVLSYSTTNTPSGTELVFFSGETGEVIGSSKDVGVAPGQMRSHMQFSTASKAQYILLHTDRGLYAVSLATLVTRAGLTSNLQKDKSWEQRADQQGLITLYNSSSDPLQSVLRVRGGYSSSSRSLLLHTQSTVMHFDAQKLSVTWTSNASNLISTPSFGNFNTDEDPDVVLEENQGNNTKRVVILDGQTGGVLWEVIMSFNPDDPQPGTILTLNSFSVFMLWGESYTHDNHTSVEGKQHSSYLLHPLHETVLLERRNSAQNIITFQALLLERSRHACYFVLTGQDGAQTGVGSEQVILTKRKIKGDVDESGVLGVGVSGTLGGDVSSQADYVKEAFYRLRFSDPAQ
ncbi:protein FAM234A [Clarias gariepinus]|uniref:protein FAM234A n=1 Tax=Clarias gariepinus TaxID=13013 RepID=UPI00234C9DCF|nr:protein FAM234A [Clarias gariepinus]